MENLKNDKGITIVALIITVIVMVVIAGISINSGTQSLDETRLKGFYTTLEIVQKRVDDIATTNEKYIDSTGNAVYLKEQGKSYSSLTSAQKSNLDNIIKSEAAGKGLIASNFRYFTSEQLKSVLDLSDIDYNVFIDFDNRVVIAENGINVKDKTYHILESNTYFVNQDINKNVGLIESFTYTASSYGISNYKIIVTPSNAVGDVTSGTLKYKKSDSKYWETSINLEMIVDELTDYDIMYEDVNNNSLAKKINLSLNSEGKLMVTEK